MTQRTGELRDGSRGTAGLQTDVAADAVRAGDTVVYTSRLNKDYEFDVADVGDEWITFETGQVVHKDRFDREDFAVRRTADGESARVRVDEEEEEEGDSASAADRELLEAPNPN